MFLLFYATIIFLIYYCENTLVLLPILYRQTLFDIAGHETMAFTKPQLKKKRKEKWQRFISGDRRREWVVSPLTHLSCSVGLLSGEKCSAIGTSNNAEFWFKCDNNNNVLDNSEGWIQKRRSTGGEMGRPYRKYRIYRKCHRSNLVETSLGPWGLYPAVYDADARQKC